MIILSSRNLCVEVRNQVMVSYPLATSAMKAGQVILLVPSPVHNEQQTTTNHQEIIPGAHFVVVPVVVPQTKTK